MPPKPFFSLLNAKVEVLLVSLHADPLRDLAPPPPPPNLAELATEALLLAKGEAFAGEGVAAEEDAAAAAFSACAFAASLQFMVSACPFSPVKSDAVELLELFELFEPKSGRNRPKKATENREKRQKKESAMRAFFIPNAKKTVGWL